MTDPDYTTYLLPKVVLGSHVNIEDQGYIIVQVENKEMIKEKVEELFNRLYKTKGYIYEPALGFLFLKKVVNTEVYEKENIGGPSKLSIDLYEAYHNSLAKQGLLINLLHCIPKKRNYMQRPSKY